MVNIRSTSDIAAKFAKVTPQRQDDFKAGVASPSKDWKTETAAAESSYASGVQTAVTNKRFSKGVVKAGTEKWKAKTLDKGVTRWGQGVAGAQSDYQSGFDPYRETIQATTLPPRYAKGDPRNIERVSTMAKALHNKKLSL